MSTPAFVQSGARIAVVSAMVLFHPSIRDGFTAAQRRALSKVPGVPIVLAASLSILFTSSANEAVVTFAAVLILMMVLRSVK